MVVPDATLLKIDNQTVPGLKSYKVSYQKVWKDQDTNMAGDFRGTLLGTWVKITGEFGGKLQEDDVAALVTLLDQDFFGLTYFDPKSKTTKTANYYVDSYDLDLLLKQIGLYNTIPIDFNPVTRTN